MPPRASKQKPFQLCFFNLAVSSHVLAHHFSACNQVVAKAAALADSLFIWRNSTPNSTFLAVFLGVNGDVFGDRFCFLLIKSKKPMNYAASTYRYRAAFSNFRAAVWSIRALRAQLPRHARHGRNTMLHTKASLPRTLYFQRTILVATQQTNRPIYAGSIPILMQKIRWI